MEGGIIRSKENGHYASTHIASTGTDDNHEGV